MNLQENIRTLLKEEYGRKYILYRGVGLDEAIKSCETGHLVYYSRDPMSRDWEVIEYGLGSEASEMSEEEVEEYVNDLVSWKRKSKGVNLTSDLDNAKGYSDIVLEINLVGYDYAEFSDVHIFAKNPEDCKIKSVYYNGKEYSKEGFLDITKSLQESIRGILREESRFDKMGEERYKSCSMSDITRMEIIDNFLKEVETNSKYNKEEPNYDMLLDDWDGYDDQVYIQNQLDEGRIIFYEGWVDSCWSAVYKKPQYEGMDEEEVIDSIITKRFPRIAEEFNMVIDDYGYFNNGDGYIMYIVLKESNTNLQENILRILREELEEYSRTLKNARKQGSGLRFPKTAIKNNPLRFRPYSRETVEDSNPKVGTGKKPEGSSRRLYTDENPSDTVSVKFKTKEDIIDTLNKDSFKSKSHKRQSQIINLIHQRVRAAYQNAKDPETKKRLKRGLDYIESKKEQSKQKTIQLQRQEQNEGELTEKCWAGYEKKGMKTMFGKRYPNCVKKTK